MTSKTEICNGALQIVEEGPLLDFSDDSERGRICRTAYDTVRQAELRKHVWNCAKRRVVLAADTEAPAFGYAYAYPLPADCLRVLRDRDSPEWAVEGRTILTDDGPALNLRYVASLEDPAQMDAAFVDALQAAIARRIAGQVTQSSTKVQLARQAYDDAIAEARRANAFENSPQELPTDDWLLARL